MKKKILIAAIVVIIIVIAVGLVIVFNTNNTSNNQEDSTRIYDQNGQLIADLSRNDEVTETEENTSIQGIVELHDNGYIYIFNGQHFGEFGFEMNEYTRANIKENNQKCIDYMTLQEYDTSYIQEGDLLSCCGDLYIKGYAGINDFDTKDNPIIVLKSNDYTEMKKEVLNGNSNYSSVVTIGESYIESGYLYLQYTLEDYTHSDTGYNLPFAVKAYITAETEIDGDLQNGKNVEVQYDNLKEPYDELNLKSIKVIEN